MNFDIDSRTILKVKHGSQAYGTNIETSDLDVKGVCIEPAIYHYGYLNKFEQHIQEASKGHETDLVIYSLKKFAKLAADCNPNIIEVLHVDDSDIISCDSSGEILRAHKDAFISTKARHTFSGYAHAQLNRIKSHRSWLLNPPKEPPSRLEFELPEHRKVTKSELGAFEKLDDDGKHEDLSKEALQLFTKERAYKNKHMKWKQYQNWKAQRNPARAELEEKYGYDTKHGMHLIRLMRMCREILRDGKVIVKRPDAEELLNIRFGHKNYDALIEEAETIDEECGKLYETSPLPKKVDHKVLDNLVVSLTMNYLRKYS